jgi:uncharacterized protein YggE
MKALGLLFVLSIAAFCQTGEGIATSVSRTVTLTPDSADFAVVVGTALTTNQQQALQMLSDAGLSSLTLTGTSLGQSYDYSTSPYTVQTLVLYQYSLSVPASSFKDTATILEKLRGTPPDGMKSFQYTAGLNASPVTVEAMNQTILPQLLADAQKKAQSLANAAGLKLGAIKSVNQSYASSSSMSTSWITSASTGNTISYASTAGGGTQFTFFISVSYALGQ